MKQWRIYLAGVLVLERDLAVRLGRTTDVVRSIDELQDCCPLPIAKVWSLRVLDNRAARGIESTIAGALSARLERSRWFRFQLGNETDKAV
ncbi:hypothetical protein, partial [Xanthomonas maliensis]|uniref:hypothetical protein n=1 Tax=Xanthomonas maliensis TaxID=1321368 RepID=UPI001EE1D86F